MIDVVSYLNTGLSTNPNEPNTVEKEMGKDSFMQLLVAQMGNQNPMEPMENTEFIAQLAQFSALEQQQNIAAGIELLALTQQASTNSQMVNLIGKRVIVPGSSISLDGENGADLRYDLSEQGAASEIIIKNSDGDIVRTADLEEMAAGSNEYKFDGKDNDGNLLEAGSYTYSILTKGNGESPTGLTQYSNYLVDSVAFSGSQVMLKAGSATIDLGDVSEVIQN
ncbi:MAG: hypothetical protein GY757_55605 [bacterium]|nr:hypothetical protein [bacterium]